MSRSVRMVGAALIPAFALPLATGNVARAAVPSPPTNNQLPHQLDIASPYVPQDTCDPQAKPGVLAFARLMASHYREYNYGISRNCTSGITEHSEGRALDWMLNSYDRHERGVADSVLAWLMAPDAQGRQGAMARRFGIMYVIWDRKIWGTYQMDAGWRTYNGPHPHTDHIHFSFSWDGAMQRTSWWTGKAWTGVSTSPSGPSIPLTPPTSYPVLSEGARAPEVQLAQKVIGVTADGIFGPATRSALTSWQRNHGVSSTGVLDKATWDRMVTLGEIPARGGSTTAQDTVRLGSRGESVKALQRILGLSVDGAFGPKTDAAVRKFQKSKSLKVNGVVDGNVWKALKGTSYKKTAISKDESSAKIPATVRRGSTGSAVRELQKVLRIGVDGVFGSQTESAVKSFQRKKSLKATGVVDSNVWKALKGMSYKKTATSTDDSSSTKIPATVRRGSTGAAVKELQKILRIGVDGVFGSQTESAVKSFQRKKSLKATGVVDSNVWKALKGMSYRKTATSGSTSKDDSSSSTAIPATVRRGSRGAAVKQLQNVLDLKADGIFGSGTEAAVKSFQRSKSLTADGIVGAKTWEALLGKRSSVAGASKGDSSTSKDDSSSSTAIPATVRRGSRGAAVKQLQNVLDLKADGIFGSGTEAAVKSFQRSKSLTADGIVGAKTWEALLGKRSSTSSGSKDDSSAGDDSSSSTAIPATVRRGSRGAAVKKLQNVLDLKADGIFGSNTESTVKSFQRSKSLTADGIVGAKTWEALLSRRGGAQAISPASFLGSAGVATVATTTEFDRLKSLVLSEGARSAGVKKVQQVVGGIAVDGVFGPATAAAVRSFQAAHELPVTGIVDEQTWDALEATRYPFLAYRTTVLKPGSTGPAVTALQSRLGVHTDGTYGPATEQAVRYLQERNRLTRTGYVGAVTWQALEREVRVPA